MKNQNQNLTYSLNQRLLVSKMASFFDKIKIIKGSKAVGIALWINPNDEFEISALVIHGRKVKMTVLNKHSFVRLEELPKVISKNLPIYLSLDGKGIIHKIIDSQDSVQNLEALLPNANSKDFIIQHIPLDENRKLISIIRNEKLEEIILKINEYGYNILKISLGPFSITGILPYSGEISNIFLPYYKVFLKKNSIDGFEKNNNPVPDFNIDLESDQLNSPFIVPFANSLQHFVDSSIASLDHPMIHYQKEEFQFKRLFQVVGLGFLIILFISLFSNFLLFEHCLRKNQSLLFKIGANKEIFNRIENLKILIITREDFLKDNKIFSRPLFAYFSDRIAKYVPAGITLKQLSIFPLQKQLIPKETYFSFLHGKILVSGSTLNSSYLNIWINELKSYSWIKQISIKNYIDNETDPAIFDLEIDLKESQL